MENSKIEPKMSSNLTTHLRMNSKSFAGRFLSFFVKIFEKKVGEILLYGLFQFADTVIDGY